MAEVFKNLKKIFFKSYGKTLIILKVPTPLYQSSSDNTNRPCRGSSLKVIASFYWLLNISIYIKSNFSKKFVVNHDTI